MHDGFNPCCIGLSAEAYSDTATKAEMDLFQSLLYWIKRWGSPRQEPSIRCTGFNPCCIGLSAEALVAPLTLFAPLGFQSLLYWIKRWGQEIERDKREEAMFQSLLYWIKRWGHRWPERHWHWTGFNPCCIGLSAEALASLVYVAAAAMFQSLLYWIKRWGMLQRLTICWPVCFNPCCIGLSAEAGNNPPATKRVPVSILVVLD